MHFENLSTLRMMSSLRIGSRRSDLARLQAQLVGDRLGATQYIFKEAPGDVNLKDPLWKMPEMGVFTSFLRKYLVSKEVDLVVHSWKDLPIDTEGLTEIVGTMERADPRDLLLVSKLGLEEAYARGKLVVLSSSPRRQFNLPEFLLKSIPPASDGRVIREIEFRDVRGNIQTRLGKMGKEGQALIVAKAAIDRFLVAENEFSETQLLVRKAIRNSHWQVLPLSVNPTAAAQGALAVEMSTDSALAEVRDSVRKILNHESSFACVSEERAVLQAFGGGCHQKIGCTVLERPWGKVQFLRGQTGGERQLSRKHITGARTQTNACSADVCMQIGGSGGLQLFHRVDIEDAADRVRESLGGSSNQSNLYVSKACAVPVAFLPAEADNRLIWTAGVQSWFALASRGFWVHGCSDGLGEQEPTGVRPIHEGEEEWVKLSHVEEPDVVRTYRLEKKKISSDDLRSQLCGKSHFFFKSGSAFAALTQLRPDLIEEFRTGRFVAGCGPGNSLTLIAKQVPVVVAYDFEDFLRLVGARKGVES